MNASPVFCLVLLLSLVATVQSCLCKNGGECNDKNTCTCKSGFYGPICSNYADSYQAVFNTEPKFMNIEEKIQSLLKDHGIKGVQRLPPGTTFKLMFYQSISDVNDIKEILEREFPPSDGGTPVQVTDFNECANTIAQQKCYTSKCVNTLGSFTCGCKDGYKIEKEKCVESKPKEEIIYIWGTVVAIVILVMIFFIIFYRYRKIEKGKKIQKEMEKKAAARLSFTPTNLDDFDGQMRRSSPTGSVFDGPSGPMGRPMSAIYNPDGTSLYSYNARMYAQAEPDFSRHRLSAPVLDSYVNQGYDIEVGPRLYSASNPESVTGALNEDGISVYSGRASAIIPTSYPSELELVRENRYE